MFRRQDLGESETPGREPGGLTLWCLWGLVINLFFLLILAVEPNWQASALAPLFPAGWSKPFEIWSDVGNTVIPLLFAPLCFLVRGLSKSDRRAPILIGLSNVSYALGTVASVWFADGPLSKLCEVFWTISYPCFIGAILLWPEAYPSRPARTRALGDALILVAALWIVTWVFAVGPHLMRHQGPWIDAVTNVAYPVFDVLALGAMVGILRNGVRPRLRVATALLVASGVAAFLGDVVWATLALDNKYIEGGWLDSSWTITCTLSNLAGYAVILWHRQRESQTTAEGRSSESYDPVWAGRLPYLLVSLVGILLTYVSAGPIPSFVEKGTYAGAVLLLLALLYRQFLIQRENGALLKRLRIAFDELKVQSQEVARQNELVEERNRSLEVVRLDLEANVAALSQANRRLAELVTVDAMTGLANHRAFQERLRAEIEAVQQYDHPLALLLVDLDDFRIFNERHGHPAGDELLRQVAKALVDQLGPRDLAARYGGEEFAVLLPFTSAASAREIAEKIRSSVKTRGSGLHGVSVSIGVGEFSPQAATADALVDLAHRSLNRAKAEGKNRVVVPADLHRRALLLTEDGNVPRSYDPSTPMGLAAILSAALRGHPQALAMEPDCRLVAALLAALELHGGEDRRHAERTMWHAMRLARCIVDLGVFELTASDLRSLAYGALLHDVGMLMVKDVHRLEVSLADPELTRDLWRHPEEGAKLLGQFPSLNLALPVVLRHHERWDGTGYPGGVAREEIPLVARIFSIVDASESMLSGRADRSPVPYAEVERELARCSGTHFDPLLVQTFLCVPARDWHLADDHPVLRINPS